MFLFERWTLARAVPCELAILNIVRRINFDHNALTSCQFSRRWHFKMNGNERPVTAGLGSTHCFSRTPGHPLRNMELMTQRWSKIPQYVQDQKVCATRKALVTVLNPICISLTLGLSVVTRVQYCDYCKREFEQKHYDFLCQRCQPGPNDSFKHALMTSRDWRSARRLA